MKTMKTTLLIKCLFVTFTSLLSTNVVNAGDTDVQYPYSFKYGGGNPLVSHVSSADPNAIVYDGVLYVYTSHDGNLFDYGYEATDDWTYAYMDGYHVFSTTDMINWIDHGEIFHSRDCKWCQRNGWMWAPAAASRNGKYYLYYPHKDIDEVWKVGVAIADTPLGPFVDTDTEIFNAVGIDPMIFIDDDNTPYMYLNDHKVAKMNDNMIELEEEFVSIDYAPDYVLNDHDMKFEEGSFVFKYDGKYYFTYSNWQQEGYTAYYGIGDNPYGPFEWMGGLSGTKFSAPDHHSIVEYKGKYYYFYHMDTPWQQKSELNWHGHRRIACFDEMFFNDDGTIQLVNPNTFYVNAGGTGMFASDGKYYNYDIWFDRGSLATYDNVEIEDTDDDELYRSHRYADWFHYDVPMSNGRYEITFKFAEKVHDEPGMRKFFVEAEGERIIDNLDVFLKAGGKNIAYDEVHVVDIADYELNIKFTAMIDNAMVSAITVVRIDMPGQEEETPNPCANEPCLNGGTCSTVDDGFTCECAADWGGTTCNIPKPCEPNPCNSGFTCLDLGAGEHECIDPTPCEPNPCDAGFQCKDLGSGERECIDIDPCDPNPCGANFECLAFDDSDEYECAEIDPCASSPCDDGFNCLNAGGGEYECIDPTPCDPNPCGSIEECKNLGNGQYKCVDEKPCDPNPCGEGNICVALGVGNYECKDMLPCDPDPCTGGKVCLDLGDGDYKCETPNEDPCDPNPCAESQLCIIQESYSGELYATCEEQKKSEYCYSGSNTVEVQGKGIITMDSLEIGDYVRDSPNTFSRVYSFGHLDHNAEAEFLQIYATGLLKPLEITEMHMMFVDGKSVRASEVKVGDKLSGSTTKQQHIVTEITTVKRRGVYAPVTYSGDITVSNVVASSYVALLNNFSASLQSKATHVVTSIHRMACHTNFDWCLNESYNDDGISNWISFAVPLLQKLNVMSVLTQILLGLLVLPIFGLAYAVESTYSFGPIMPLLIVVIFAFWRLNKKNDSKTKIV